MSQRESTTIPPFLNKVMTGMLRSPLHRVVSGSIMLITFTGCKSGKSYTTPISYTLNNGQVTAFTHAKWWRNLVGGAPVTLNIKNKEYQGHADVVADDKEVVATGLQAFLRKVPSDAKYYKVNIGEDGEPNWDEVQRAAQQVVMLQVALVDTAQKEGVS